MCDERDYVPDNHADPVRPTTLAAVNAVDAIAMFAGVDLREYCYV